MDKLTDSPNIAANCTIKVHMETMLNPIPISKSLSIHSNCPLQIRVSL